MATFTYSQLTFTAGAITLPSATGTYSTGDKIVFDNEAISASDLTLAVSGSHLTISFTETTAKVITLRNFTQNKISSSNITFADGSQLFIGDNAITTTNDANVNTLTSSAYDDYLDGMGGSDTVSYKAASAGVTVNLTTATAQDTGGAGTDKLLNIENLIGSSYNDSLTGGASGSTLDGGLGIDTLTGGAGNDTFVVTAGDTVSDASAADTDLVKSSVDSVLPSNIENLTLTGGAIFGSGNAVGNTIIGTTGNNILNGAAGNDTLKGGAGNDTYLVDSATDVIDETVTGSAGTDIVWSTAASFTLGTNVENLRLMGTAAINGTGNTANNTIYANSGNNTLDGAGTADSDTLSYEFGATSGVTLSLASVAAQTTGGSGSDTISNFENLTGSRFSDSLTGGTGVNVLTGGLGNDTLTGASSNDSLVGGTGNDTYVVDSTSYTITDTGGTDTVKASATFTIASISTIENLTANGAAGISLTGNTLGNTLDSESNAQNDTLIGGAGNDTYLIDSTSDVVTEGLNAGTDLVKVSVTGYTMDDNIENLTLTAASAATATGNDLGNTLTATNNGDTLNGGDGNDKLVGGTGIDSLNGGVGNDNMAGGTGNDTYAVDVSGDTITEASGAGTDTVTATVSYLLAANLENLTLSGTSAINGTGNSAANTLTGNSKANILTGGTGADTFVGSAGKDTIADFTTGTDKLDLNAVIAGTTGTISTISAGAAVATADRKDFVDVIDAVDGTAASLTTSGTATLTAGNLTASTLTALATYLAEHWTGVSSATGTDTGVFILNSNIGSTAGNAYIYLWDNDTAANTIQAAELTLIGTVTAEPVANTDIVALA